MNIRTIATTTLACCAAAGSWAQSSITIGGVIDAAARQVRNEGRGAVSSLASGGNSTSRLIFRGSDDLGDGMSASFHLETGLLLDTGTSASATQFWDRRSTLSLATPALGELRGGRDYVPTYTLWTRHDPFSYVGVAGSTNLLANSQQGPVRAAFGTTANTLVRASNTLQWLLPSAPAGMAGLEGGVMVSAREGGNSADGQHKLQGVRLGYVTKAFSVGAATSTTESNLTTLGRFRDTSVGAIGELGMARVSAAWRRLSYGPATQTDVMLGLWWPVAGGEVKASWHRANLDGKVGSTAVQANDATQWGLGYVYSLSRRSALYASCSRISNDGAATFTVPGGASGMTAGGRSTGYELGVRHTF
ncbi:porin [Ideonella sp. DXS22W]|uniref:Porin n=1 Tax=Pseudaquabacterium inlustre TaxID=2984192 RepID=A0ABU9CQP9_9BURK